MIEYPLNKDPSYITTEACQADVWLVASPKLIFNGGHPFSRDILHMYGFLPKEGLYVVESFNRSLRHGYHDRNKVIIGISKEDFEAQMNSGFWSVLTNQQWELIVSLSRQIEEKLETYTEEVIRNNRLANLAIEGFVWHKFNNAPTWLLVPENDLTNTRVSLGMYKRLKDGTWKCTHLDSSSQTKPPKRKFNSRRLRSETECRACIFWEITAYDPNAFYWKVIPSKNK